MRAYDGAADGSRPEEPGEDPVELITPEDFLGPSGIPGDARRLGLDRNTQEGALIAFAGSLDPTRTLHRVVAWVLLLAFAVPMALGLARPLF